MNGPFYWGVSSGGAGDVFEVSGSDDRRHRAAGNRGDSFANIASIVNAYLLGALAPTFWALVSARAVQGLTRPATMAIRRIIRISGAKCMASPCPGYSDTAI